MGLIAIYVLITFILAMGFFSGYKSGKHPEYRWTAFFNTIVSCSVFLVVVVAIILGTSYYEYVDLKTRQVTINQQKQALDLYVDRLSTQAFKGDAAYTDLKYNQYQNSVKELIENYTTEVTRYNKALIAKRVKGSNWMFKGLVIMPDDDMQVINM